MTAPRRYMPTPEEEWDAAWDTLVDEAAELEGRHGSDKVWDAERKSLASAIQHRLRGEYAAQNVHVTEGRLAEEAHCDDDYKEFIATAIRERADLFRKRKALQKMEHQHFREQSRMKAAASGLR